MKVDRQAARGRPAALVATGAAARKAIDSSMASGKERPAVGGKSERNAGPLSVGERAGWEDAARDG